MDRSANRRGGCLDAAECATKSQVQMSRMRVEHAISGRSGWTQHYAFTA